MQAIPSIDETSFSSDSPAVRPTSIAIRDEAEKFNAEMRRVGHGELRDIRVDVSDQGVVLQGRVSSFYLKQLAQEAVRPLSRSLRIRNQIDVTGKKPLARNRLPIAKRIPLESPPHDFE
ncbi:BON domain-containing protein [Rhodopirellula sp. P2]|uniref:BON domain-containing protein n=1 Tax=Rhodopirellula sp. P2 TaxID=2127060 RepID=UPI002368E6FF|nr:BON domain-containing protein [Rhodopirellula sp. P2]WDQ14860.1 BON domain-containing protein [Rhodopirellula sp. P2]